MTHPTTDLTNALGPLGLTVLGWVPLDAPLAADRADLDTLALIGPDGGAMWPVFQASPEARDGAADPLDRWSRRALDAVANAVGGHAVYPFGGPPWHPFIDWARRSGRIWSSPVHLLVHADQGLFVSFRGAIAVRGPAPALPPVQSPCDTCETRPCLRACPVDAFAQGNYDVAACKAHLDSPQGVSCQDGCLVRRACPVGQGLRDVAQSAFHMAAFHRRPS